LWGRRKTQGRSVNGVLLLDKPVGVTSNNALQQVRRIYQARKAGHTGNLDAPASGLLPLCFGEATKVSTFLLNAPKSYRAAFQLGITTTTGDSTGQVRRRRRVSELSKEEIISVLALFTGVIDQVPPMHSAIKHQGQPLYKLAREGIVVERKARAVEIYALDLVSWDRDLLEVTVRCSKGTYIRTLAEDIGERLGSGAHVLSLRRLGVGPLRIEEAVTLEEVKRLGAQDQERLQGVLRPLDSAVLNQPGIHLSEEAAFYLCRGQAVMVPHAPSTGLVRLYDRVHEFLGIGQVLADGRVAPLRLVSS
jgi:tRNA pseudouridine55 synthase